MIIELNLSNTLPTVYSEISRVPCIGENIYHRGASYKVVFVEHLLGDTDAIAAYVRAEMENESHQ